VENTGNAENGKWKIQRGQPKFNAAGTSSLRAQKKKRRFESAVSVFQAHPPPKSLCCFIKNRVVRRAV
jgi:hypothetical protein